MLTVFSLVITILLINLLLPTAFLSNYKIGYIKYSVVDNIFSSKYIFWIKPYCEKDCDNYLEEISGNKVVSFGEEYGNCEKILFLGDSFTYAPWDENGRSYAEHFTEKLSQLNKACYTVVRLATCASNNDQQFAILSDVVKKIGPKLVVWQFCWNDLFENTAKRLYRETNEDEFERISALGNMYFWSGWIYQKIPFLMKDTNLGMFLLSFGELKRDLFFDWNETIDNTDLFLNMNSKKVKYFLNEVEDMGKNNGFEFITTLVPLECGLGSPESCNSLDEKTNQFRYRNFLRAHNFLSDVLKNNSRFVSMYENEAITDEQKLNMVDFRVEDDDPGTRHLSASGLKKTGDALFLNFIAATDQGLVKFK